MSAVQDAQTIRLTELTELPDRSIVGGKAWSLARLAARGLPVPAAFVVPTAVCNGYHASGSQPPGLRDALAAEIAWLEDQTGRRFGDGSFPLLVSVRSGAPVSMPGMMDTVLNLGVSRARLDALAAEFDESFARDTLRRFLDLYVSIVMRATPPGFDAHADSDTWFDQLAERGLIVPEDPMDQLTAAVSAVFDSWESRRARRYREVRGIPDDLGTAVTVQAMVFGNRDEASGTGVLFSRDPRTGARAPYGQYLPKAQGEDVVSGRVDPLPLDVLAAHQPAVHAELLRVAETLESEDGDVQDIEFTVESGRLYVLQSRVASRTPAAAVRIAVDMVDAGIITPTQAVARVNAEQARIVLKPRIAGDAGPVVVSGEAASGGAGVGMAVADPDEAEKLAAEGVSVVLVRETTSPEDVHGMIAANAVVTSTGGGTSHAAVVARALGAPCVVGCGPDTVAALVGREITVDGDAGTVHAGAADVVAPREADDPVLGRLLAWASERSPVQVLAEAPPDQHVVDLDTISEAAEGVDVGAVKAVVAGATTVRGQVLRTPDVLRAALDAGVRVLVTEPTLPVHLEAIAWAEAQR